MSLDSSLYTYLSGVSAITALVSTRIYPNQAPYGTSLPYVAHNRVSERRFQNLTGSPGTVRTRLQLDVFAATPDSAVSVFEALRTNLDGWRGATMGGLNVLSVNLDDMRSDFTPPSDGSDLGTHRVSADFIFLYDESISSV